MVLISVMIISIIIVLVVLLGFVLTVNKGYEYKHTIDPLPKESEEIGKEKEKVEDETEKEE